MNFFTTQPISCMLSAVIYAMIGNLTMRYLFTFVGARKSMVFDGQVNSRLQKTFELGALWIFYVPAACYFVYGISSAWHLGHVSTTLIGIGAALVSPFIFGYLKGDNQEWCINHFRRRRQGLLFFGGLVFVFVFIFFTNLRWHYEDLSERFYLIFGLWLGDLYTFNYFEVEHWREVGVNIRGDLVNPGSTESRAYTELVRTDGETDD